MARLYANENFPAEVVSHLRGRGHDVLTTHETGRSNQAIEDDAVSASCAGIRSEPVLPAPPQAHKTR